MRTLAPPALKASPSHRREERISERAEHYLGPVAIAVWVEIGWMLDWPLALTRVGMKARRNGYGRDRLPIGVASSGPAYHWEGRVAET